MKHYRIILLGLVIVGFLIDSCTKEASLKDTYRDDFLIGAALNVSQIEEKIPEATAIIPQQFSSITSENVMKCMHIHPQWDQYNFELPDKLVAYGKKHNMFIVGHTLIWHNQLAPFVKKIQNRDSLLQFMTNHINTIASRYDGKVNGWDVVNEALNEDGSMRETIFYNLLGEEYVVKAFQLAEKAAPNTKLYYNDYNIEKPEKRKGAIVMIKKLQEAGVRIDGVGIQGHWSLNGPPIEEIEQSIIEFAALGIEVMITELDVTVIPSPWELQGAEVTQNFENDPKMNPFINGLPDSVQTKLANRYEEIFKMFLKHSDKISRVTFWGVNDGSSWLNNWPIRGRTNYPLLFDRVYKPKAAFHKVIQAME